VSGSVSIQTNTVPVDKSKHKSPKLLPSGLHALASVVPDINVSVHLITLPLGPLGPVGPVCPCGPVCPFCPCNPVAPCIPC